MRDRQEVARSHACAAVQRVHVKDMPLCPRSFKARDTDRYALPRCRRWCGGGMRCRYASIRRSHTPRAARASRQIRTAAICAQAITSPRERKKYTAATRSLFSCPIRRSGYSAKRASAARKIRRRAHVMQVDMSFIERSDTRQRAPRGRRWAASRVTRDSWCERVAVALLLFVRY